MNAIERAGFLSYSRSRVFASRLARAKATIDEGFRLCRKPFVAFSAGKDSSAMLWLVAEAKPDASALMLTGGETRILYPSLDNLLAWWRGQWPRLNLREICVDHVFADGWQDVDWATQWRTFFGEWDKYLHASDDWDGVFLGLRADESNKRRIALSLRLADCPYAIHRYADSRPGASAGSYRIAPLDAWTTVDVAALITQHDIPLLETYETEGIDARTHLRTGNISLRMGQVAELRRRDPPGYNRLIARFPELAQWS